MNIVGCILFVISGIIAIKVSGVTKKQGLSDYSKCNTAIGKVTHTEDCCGDRWIVYFTDDSGRKQVGMDDIIAASSFSNKYKRPTSGTDEQVYYYPRTDNGIYRINQDSVDYYIHFCNEDLYELQRHVANRTDIMGKIIGSCLIFAALLILIFG